MKYNDLYVQTTFLFVSSPIWQKSSLLILQSPFVELSNDETERLKRYETFASLIESFIHEKEWLSGAHKTLIPPRENR